MIKEDQMNQITSSIYQISTIMNSILKVVETPYVNNQFCVFSPENTVLVVDILCLLMPKSLEILRDFNIMDKIMIRLSMDLQVALAGAPLFTYKPQLEMVTVSAHTQLISHMLKLLAQPFVRKSSAIHSMQAPTHARKIANSNLLQLCS